LTQVKIVPRLSATPARTELFIARSIHMLDLILLAIGLGFFALSVGYTIACDRL
jgi:hypothetical protein